VRYWNEWWEKVLFSLKYYKYAHTGSLLQPDFTCPFKRRIGGHGDGPKWTCNPHRLYERKDCLIYSIGSEGDYLFEESLIRLLGSLHCEIHVFDPGNYARPGGDPEKNNIHYHQWGLKSSYDSAYSAEITLNALNGAAPAMMTFQETQKALGHKGRTIDIFKINCEKCEWANYKDWISADIRQVIIQTHGVPSPVRGNQWHHKSMQVSDFFDSFTENNFAMFSKELVPKSGGNCIEFSFVKLHSDFWGGEFKANFKNRRKHRGATSPAAMLAARGARNSLQRTEPLQKLSLPIFQRTEPVQNALSVPSNQSASVPKIPKQLIFTSRWNILEQKGPSLVYENLKNTIQKYQEAWPGEEVEIWFLDDRQCRSAIQATKPELLGHFDGEANGSYKADICRVAALQLKGGYYFDVDIEVMEAFIVPNDVTFSTVIDDSDMHFFQAFMASVPSSPILEQTLEVMLNYYGLPEFNRPLMKLGPSTLFDAYNNLSLQKRGSVYMLNEIDLLKYPSAYPDIVRRDGEGCCCNYAVHDQNGSVPKVFFYSRIVGYSGFCMAPGTTVDPLQELAAEQAMFSYER
jgi:hypothetical protein